MEKIVNIMNKKRILGFVISAILLFMSFKWIVLQRSDYLLFTEGKVKLFVYGIIGGGFVFLSLISYFFGKKLGLDKLFLVIYFSIGITYMLVTPLSSTPDETEHMLRAYGISIGDFVPAQNDNLEGGSYVPDNLLFCWNRGGANLKDMKEHLFMVANENKEFVTYSNTALYSPLTYMPQAIGIFAARLIFDRPFIMGYAGRLAELLAVGIILYFAIRLTPIGKQIIFVFSLLPINMYECASLSGGGLTYAIIIFLVSYSLYLRYTHEGVMSFGEKALLHIILLFVASCKIVYVPFVLMAFIIPKEKFGNKRKYITNICIAGILILLASVGWLSISSRYLIEYNEGVSSAEQVKFVLTHPFSYLQVIINTLSSEGNWIMRTFFAEFLGYFDVQGNIVMIIFSAANLIYVCVTERLNVKLDLFTKVFLWLSFGFSMICIFSSLYVQWNPLENEIVTGLQGRYFLPLAYPLVILLKKCVVTCKENEACFDEGLHSCGLDIMSGSKMIICFVNALTLATLFVHYI